jgi:hypothetical protein
MDRLPGSRERRILRRCCGIRPCMTETNGGTGCLVGAETAGPACQPFWLSSWVRARAANRRTRRTKQRLR